MRFDGGVTGPILEPALLVGDHVRLEPLDPRHAAGLAVASADGEGWRKWTTTVPTPDGVPAEIDRRIAEHDAGRMVPWATCLPDGTPVGMTTYMNIDQANRRLEIGSTWLAASAQGTKVNPEAKLLQLTRAFDELDCIAVEFRTHWHNRQSRRAIAGLGAKQDGVLRNHLVWRDGTLRDTVVFSIVRDEWPAVRSGLRARLGSS
jgi:RimJ/RimL family protein N-acetyltransferase